MAKDLYFVSYDLKKKESDQYQKLYDKFEELEALQITESTWAFKKDNTSSDKMRDSFEDLIYPNDKLIVVKSSGWGSLGLDKTPKNL